jgi:uncharacterized protein involved in exopolysaccharide biosynthesis
MQRIGEAQSAQQAGSEGIQALAKEVAALGKQAMRVAQLAKAVHPPLAAYVVKIAEIGEAMQTEIQQVAQQSQQGAAPVQTSSEGRIPTEGPTAGAAAQG